MTHVTRTAASQWTEDQPHDHSSGNRLQATEMDQDNVLGVFDWRLDHVSHAVLVNDTLKVYQFAQTGHLVYEKVRSISLSRYQ